MAFSDAASPVRLAVNACHGPSSGVMTQTRNHGSIPRTPNTATSIPHVRNHLRALCCIVASVSALMMALSMLVIDSNSARPRIISTEEMSTFHCPFERPYAGELYYKHWTGQNVKGVFYDAFSSKPDQESPSCLLSRHLLCF